MIMKECLFESLFLAISLNYVLVVNCVELCEQIEIDMKNRRYGFSSKRAQLGHLQANFSTNIAYDRYDHGN